MIFGIICLFLTFALKGVGVLIDCMCCNMVGNTSTKS